MTDHHLEINDIVLSSNFGLGKIVAFEKFGGGDQEFAVIESLEKKVKMMSPLNQSLNFRKLSTEQIIVGKLEAFKKLDGSKSFDSKKDRITYFKSQSHKQDLDSIMQTIAELHAIEDRGTVENKIYENLVNSIKLEVATIMQIEDDEAAKIVDSNLVN